MREGNGKCELGKAMGKARPLVAVMHSAYAYVCVCASASVTTATRTTTSLPYYCYCYFAAVNGSTLIFGCATETAESNCASRSSI